MHTDERHVLDGTESSDAAGGGDAAHRVRITPRGLEFVTDGARTVLAAAEAHGVLLPSSCRNGTCRTCLCRLTSGTVSYAIAWPGLSAEEQREGWILPCVALAGSDLIIDSPAARQSPAPLPTP